LYRISYRAISYLQLSPGHFSFRLSQPSRSTSWLGPVLFPLNSTPLEALLNQISYKGFQIVAHPFRFQIGYLERWGFKVEIIRLEGKVSKNFVASLKFGRKQEAIENCFEYGKQIIDGQVPGCSVGDL
jgi:hypothetical protein